MPSTRVPAIDLSRPRGLGGILGGAFSLYWRYFGLFSSIAFAVVIPCELLGAVLSDGPETSSWETPCGPQHEGFRRCL